MASSELSKLFIQDSEYSDSGTYASYVAEAQRIWGEYLKLSRTLVEVEKALRGERAKSYSLFVTTMEAAVGNKLCDIMDACAADMKQYITDIDTADQAMY